MSERLIRVINACFDGQKSRFAKALGMTPQSLNNYLNENRTPGYKLVSKLIDLGINAHWLYTGKGEMFFNDHDQVSEPVSQYNTSDPLYINVIAIYQYLNQSDLTDEKKLELVKGFQKDVLLEQNEAFIQKLTDQAS